MTARAAKRVVSRCKAGFDTNPALWLRALYKVTRAYRRGRKRWWPGKMHGTDKPKR